MPGEHKGMTDPRHDSGSAPTAPPVHLRRFPNQLCPVGDDLMLDRQRYRLIAVEHHGDGRVQHHLLPLP